MKTKNTKTGSKSTQKTINKKEKSWKVLLVKFIILITIVVSIVGITDKKGYFISDYSKTEYKNRVYRRWNSFYQFTEKDTVDVLLVGNSHLYSGVDALNLSCALGCNCMVLAAPGVGIIDAYYTLEEAFSRTKPKVVIIETYGISDKKDKSTKDPQSLNLSFDARHNFFLKMRSTFHLFDIENWLPSWSSTLRNHSMIFSDKEDVRPKKSLRNRHEHELYLGRYAQYTTGISDSVMNRYQFEGAPVDGANRLISKSSAMYVQKIVKLCHKYGAKPVFITIPMYSKHVKNYQTLRNHLAEVIEPTGAYWKDYQQQYDTILFDRNCFQDTYDENQHMTYYGSIVCAYKLAHLLSDSLCLDLPDRTKSEHWTNLFYGKDGYFENNPSLKQDPTNVLVCKNQYFGEISVKDCIMKRSNNANIVYLKIAKNEKSNNPSNTLMASAIFNVKGVTMNANIEFIKIKGVDPLHHHLYQSVIDKDVELVKILGIKKVLE